MGRDFDNQCVVGFAGRGGAECDKFGKELSYFKRDNRVEFWIGGIIFIIRAELGDGRDDSGIRGDSLFRDADFKAAIH
jgi:hypothetical protein